jgi:uncharacterized damage-inducible protein DinB
MWQRFTERARKVVFYSQEEALRFGEGYVSTEHLLLGLVRESDSTAARVLDKLGISLKRVRTEVEMQLPQGDARPNQDLTLTPRAKWVIDLAYDEARNLNNNYIGTEHLLLGLIREGDGLAGRVLAKLGMELEKARREVMILQDNVGSAPPHNAVEFKLKEEPRDSFLKVEELRKALREITRKNTEQELLFQEQKYELLKVKYELLQMHERFLRSNIESLEKHERTLQERIDKTKSTSIPDQPVGYSSSMLASEFASSQAEDCLHQLSACFKDVNDEHATQKPVECMMSIRETALHLMEAYTAIEKAAKGEKHEWGSFSDPGGDFASLIEKFHTARAVAVAAALASMDTNQSLIKDYVIGHEYYHVGQLVSLRLMLDSNWDHYSIYKH